MDYHLSIIANDNFVESVARGRTPRILGRYVSVYAGIRYRSVSNVYITIIGRKRSVTDRARLFIIRLESTIFLVKLYFSLKESV